MSWKTGNHACFLLLSALLTIRFSRRLWRNFRAQRKSYFGCAGPGSRFNNNIDEFEDSSARPAYSISSGAGRENHIGGGFRRHFLSAGDASFEAGKIQPLMRGANRVFKKFESGSSAANRRLCASRLPPSMQERFALWLSRLAPVLWS